MNATVTSAEVKRPTRESMLGRVTSIVDAYTSPNERLNLEKLASRTGLPRSTTHRILVEMVERDWLMKHDGDYRLGPRALGTVGPEVAQAHVRIAANDIIHELYLRTDTVIHLGVLHGGHEYFLDKMGGPLARVFRSRVGTKFPAHRGVGGRSMLAMLAPEEVDPMIEKNLASTDFDGPKKLQALHAELARIRTSHGIAYQANHKIPGFGSGRGTSLGCAIRTHDGAVVSLCVAGEAGKVHLDRVAPLVRKAADDLAAAI
ncbi:IclR family transcriptional regulator [Rhodococcus sp. ARC_M6]|uniref:IclR family transcriptional regulator n=1 Tax=Rhodococcus sp. ARC_M6 TaxID=2928852 RepID=UPI001FB39F6B|nr:IclR family transcriptional regulator C-terminal domain-containing protein [Rhodococcus sp. ARC_M6]MCJ0906358.1 helix-turn-helix domain-containing protein [Rhodococcus sp. ARC_M6]